MQRPAGIQNTTILMALIFVAETTLTFLAPVPELHHSTPLAMSFLGIFKTLAVFFQVLAAVFVYFYRRGQNWARWLVIIDAVLVLLALFGIHKAWSNYHSAAILSAIKACLAIYLLVYLNQLAIKAWFSPPVLLPYPPQYPPLPPQ